MQYVVQQYLKFSEFDFTKFQGLSIALKQDIHWSAKHAADVKRTYQNKQDNQFSTVTKGNKDIRK